MRSFSIAVFLILVTVLSCFAQVTDPASTPPTPAPVVNVVENPESPSNASVLWWTSVAANGISTYLKWNSAWKQVASDPIHAEPSGPYAGKYYVRATVYDWGVFGIGTAAQYFLCRKYPSLKRSFGIVNFSASGLNFAQFGYNVTGH